MRHKTLLTPIIMAMAMAAWLLVLLGCQPKPQEVVMEMPQLAEPLPDETAQPTDAEFTWSDAPTVDEIPDVAIIGMVNGKPFEAKTVRVKEGDKGPEITISDGTADTPTGVIINDTGFELRFPMEASTTGQFTKTFDDEVDFDTTHAFYWYPQDGDKGPMSVNPIWGCAVEITEWTLAEDPEDQEILGNVKGKLAITCDDEHKSWIVGTFDAIYYKW